MITAVWVAVLVLGAAVIVGLLRVALAEDDGSRAVVGDLVYFSAVGVMILYGILAESAAVLDAALLASLLGIIATVALARIITRGRR